PPNQQVDRLVRVDGYPLNHVFPVGIFNILDLHDAVAGLNSSLRRRRAGKNAADVRVRRPFVVHHVHAGKNRKGKNDVHGWSGNRDNEPLPARVAHELTSVPGTVFHRVFTGHLYVPADWKEADPVVCATFVKANQPLAKSEAEYFNPDVEQLGHGVVAELMDENQHAEHKDDGWNFDQELARI